MKREMINRYKSHDVLNCKINCHFLITNIQQILSVICVLLVNHMYHMQTIIIHFHQRATPSRCEIPNVTDIVHCSMFFSWPEALFEIVSCILRYVLA